MQFLRLVENLLKILKNSQTLALISDAGLPGISDPGYELARAAEESGFPVVGIPGPSAVTNILSMCPFPTESFLFVGFPPRKQSDLVKFLKEYVALNAAIVMFESPKRLRKLLDQLVDLYPERTVFIGREMTKIHEETFHGSLVDALTYFIDPKGEFTLVLSKPSIEMKHLDRTEIYALVQQLFKEGLGIREISREVVSLSGLKNTEAYQLVLDTLK